MSVADCQAVIERAQKAQAFYRNHNLEGWEPLKWNPETEEYQRMTERELATEHDYWLGQYEELKRKTNCALWFYRLACVVVVCLWAFL